MIQRKTEVDAGRLEGQRGDWLEVTQTTTWQCPFEDAGELIERIQTGANDADDVVADIQRVLERADAGLPAENDLLGDMARGK